MVVGLFDTKPQADAAMKGLLNSGFSRDQVYLKDYQEVIAESKAGYTAKEEGGFTASMRHFMQEIGLSSDERSDLTTSEGFRVKAMEPDDALVFVRASDDMADKAAQILNSYDALDIEDRISKMKRARVQTKAGQVSDETTIPVMEEELQIGKRSVISGGVRIYTHLTEKPVEEQVRLKQEKVDIERHAVDRPVSEGELEAFEEETIELRETSEEPVVAKRARVKEEVTVRKQAKERTETIRETLRSTKVDVEPLSPEEEKEFSSLEPDFRNDYQGAYSKYGVKYEEILPVYQYGYHMSHDPRFQGGEWNEVEPEIRRDWEEHGYGPWEPFREAVHSGWEKGARH